MKIIGYNDVEISGKWIKLSGCQIKKKQKKTDKTRQFLTFKPSHDIVCWIPMTNTI